MKNIWAPWRIKYITQKKEKKCIFCLAYKSLDDEKHFVLFRNKLSFAILNTFPYNNGHFMVVPNRHIADLELLSEDEVVDIYKTAVKIISVLKKIIKPHGFNIGINMGEVAGAGIKSHLHIHVVPRWKADTNFMPVISDTKVISQSLTELYKEIKKELKK